jgi:hypothetical protein
MRKDALVNSIGGLVATALECGALDVPGVSQQEHELVEQHSSGPVAKDAARQILDGLDPLGDAFGRIFSPVERRPLGQTYTPAAIVEAMVSWAHDQSESIERIVDPGTGSGRYLLAAGRRFTNAVLVGSEVDPLAALIARANLATTGMADRATIHLVDFRALDIPAIDGRTLWLGNPPYVRHHQVAAEWKRWLVTTARGRGLDASALAGLHVHFFLATAEHGKADDLGAFITSAEWLDVNYGSLVRDLLLDGLGGQSIHVLEADTVPFTDAATTGAITTFRLGSKPSSLKLRRVANVGELGSLDKGRAVSRQRLAEANRWSVLTRTTPKLPEGYVELGELCRVHRGTVTGANSTWVQERAKATLPESVLFTAVTKARDLFKAGERLADASALKVVIDLPVDLDELAAEDRKPVEKFLKNAKRDGVHLGYIASTRKAWWSVGLRHPAPILATYMARRPPAFVSNEIGARHINIAHGLYPRQAMEASVLARLAAHLRSAVTLAQGRTYAGGLTKFEPKEMERLTVPSLELLQAVT